MTRRSFTFVAALLVTAAAAGPAGAAIPGHADLGAVDTTGLPALSYPLPDRASLAAEDKAAAARGEPYRFALTQDVSLTTVNAGRWSRLDQQREIWRLRLASPGALSLNLGFTVCDLPSRATLVVRPAGGGESLIYAGGDLQPGDELWTPVLLTDDLVVELSVQDGERDRVQLELAAFNRGYRFFGERSPAKSGACNVDVVCAEGDPWRTEIKAVAAYSLGGNILCTGAMVNNTAVDGTPLFLTAAHCPVTPTRAPSIVVYWNFESPVCGAQSGGSKTDAQSGSDYLAGSVVSDFCLLQLRDDPDPAWGVTFAGWNRADAAPSSGVTIHHPSGDEKSISFENDPLTISLWPGADPPVDGSHLRVWDWDVGTTEAGSSGAPLFGPDHLIVGQLHGGNAACGNNESDWFGRLAAAWEGEGTPVTRLKDWLDPAGTGAVTLDHLLPMSVTPYTGVRFSGPLGGPFSPVSAVFTLRNNEQTAVDWTAAAGAGWLGVTPSQGTLAPGTQAIVTVAPSAAAEILPAGTHTTSVAFTRLGVESGTTSRLVTLTVLGGRPTLVSVGPNPFRTYTTVTYTLGVPARVHGRVYDVAGRQIADLGTDDPGAGEALEWEWYGRDQDGRLLPSGLYFLELDAAGQKLRVPVTFLH